MDKDSSLQKEYEKVLDSLSVGDEKSTEISKPTIFEEIQDQRKNQRDLIIHFSLWMSGLSVLFIGVLISIQAVKRFYDPSFSILDSHQLEIIATSIVAQTFGIIYVITKSLWNDSVYEKLLDKDYDNGHKHDRSD